MLIGGTYFLYAIYFDTTKQPIGLRTGGDEPHYLLTAKSLLNDKDFNLKNNYNPSQWTDFYNYAQLDLHVVKVTPEAWYSIHSPGLSFLLLPILLVTSNLFLIRIYLAIFAILSLVVIFEVCYGLTGNRFASGLTIAVVGLTRPYFTHSILLFPEIIASLCISLLILRHILIIRHNQVNLVSIGILLGVIPYLHLRYLPLVLFFIILFTFDVIIVLRKIQRLFEMFLPFILLITGLILYYVILFGSLDVDKEQTFWSFSMQSLALTFYNIFFNPRKGLFTNAPIYLLSAVGLFHVIKEKQLEYLPLLALVFYLPLIASFGNWYGEWSPAARYLVVVTGVLSMPLATFFARLKTWRTKFIFYFLSTISILISASIFLSNNSGFVQLQ